MLELEGDFWPFSISNHHPHIIHSILFFRDFIVLLWRFELSSLHDVYFLTSCYDVLFMCE